MHSEMRTWHDKNKQTNSQMHRSDKHTEHSSIIWPVWPNGRVFVYELSGSGFESSCSHLNFRFHVYFEQRFRWHSGNYRLWIHSETRTWHDKNIQCKFYVGMKFHLNTKNQKWNSAWREVGGGGRSCHIAQLCYY